jgi:hypothetical protein
MFGVMYYVTVNNDRFPSIVTPDLGTGQSRVQELRGDYLCVNLLCDKMVSDVREGHVPRKNIILVTLYLSSALGAP